MRRLAAAAFIAFFTIACSDKTPDPNVLSGIPLSAPAWIQNPDSGGRFGAAGGAPQSIGGVRFQQIEASATASDILRSRIAKIAIGAAQKSLRDLNSGASDEQIDADAKSAAKMIDALAASRFARAENWWSPSRDYYALLRLPEEELKKIIVDTISRFAASSESYSANFGTLRALKTIENAAQGAIAAAK
jgi:hypothetical protein